MNLQTNQKSTQINLTNLLIKHDNINKYNFEPQAKQNVMLFTYVINQFLNIAFYFKIQVIDWLFYLISSKLNILKLNKLNVHIIFVNPPPFILKVKRASFPARYLILLTIISNNLMIYTTLHYRMCLINIQIKYSERFQILVTQPNQIQKNNLGDSIFLNFTYQIKDDAWQQKRFNIYNKEFNQIEKKYVKIFVNQKMIKLKQTEQQNLFDQLQKMNFFYLFFFKCQIDKNIFHYICKQITQYYKIHLKYQYYLIMIQMFYIIYNFYFVCFQEQKSLQINQL
ncbi:transmembrane protein, putative (macronuclear) [Tetrahymena thermophila SB210]|uniref:Transmembrane protein, putative n=1 Tax=Tetrahymena thermophila (strain SB210) TaxID=312017 RepID=W7XJH1_TETTS|nr:transmembrane protein, putative [Tetrahymena thermophila SB210]EWS75516.1 transmembrane protein, putative [Tetrahymena thermophila SB210]|eukprot:XP_012651985.1 transmembrane protein, putative [Tetrahymena thermophila SB210]